MEDKAISKEWLGAAAMLLLVACAMVLDARIGSEQAIAEATAAQSAPTPHEPMALADAAARLALEKTQDAVKP